MCNFLFKKISINENFIINLFITYVLIRPILNNNSTDNKFRLSGLINICFQKYLKFKFEKFKY